MSESVIDGGATAPVTGANVTEATPAQNTAGTPIETKAESPPAVETPNEDPKGYSKRIDELTRHRRGAERALAESRRQNERLLAILEQQRQSGAPQGQPSGQPQAQQHQAPSEDDLLRSAAELLKKEQRRARYDERVARFKATAKDYDEVIDAGPDPDRNPLWACPPPIAEYLEESEEGPALAYYLAQNPDESFRLARMSPALAGRELTRIEDRLIAERKKAAEKPVSQAPPPPPKIDAADSASAEKDPSKMTDAQFKKWREKQIAARGS